MTTYKDFSLGIRMDDETSYGAGGVEADALSIGKVTNFSSNLSDSVHRLLGIGEGRNETSYVYGNVDITGSMEWIMLAQMNATIGSISLLKYAIGKVQGSGTTAAPYEMCELDEIGYTASTIPTFALWYQNEGGTTDDVDRYEGCTVSSFTLTATQGDVLKCTLDFVAQKVTSAAAITTAYATPTDAPWVFQQGSFKWGAAPTAVAKVSSFSLTMGNNLFIYRSLGSRFIEQPEMGRRVYDWTLTVKMTDAVATTLRDDFYGAANAFVAGTDPSTITADDEISLEFVEGSGASGDKKMVVALDQCAIIGMSKAVSVGQGLVEVTFTGIAKMGKPDGADEVPVRYWTIT